MSVFVCLVWKTSVSLSGHGCTGRAGEQLLSRHVYLNECVIVSPNLFMKVISSLEVGISSTTLFEVSTYFSGSHLLYVFYRIFV